MLAAGGASGSGASDGNLDIGCTAEVYDVENNEWRRCANMSEPRSVGGTMS